MSNTLPPLAIVIPCFNHGKYLLEAIESVRILCDEVLASVIIVNDGSTDQVTIDALKNLKEDGWLIINQPNLGLATARNNGIKESKAPYILPLDSDNLILPQFVKEAITLLNNDKSVDIIYSDSIHFGEDNHYNKVGEFDPCRLINDNYIDACAIFRREVWEDLGGYDAKMPAMGHEDWDFWVGAMMKKKYFKYIEKPGFKYRVRNDSMLRSQSQTDGHKIRQYVYGKYNQKLFESISLNFNPDDSIYRTKYVNLKTYLKTNRIKSLLKIIFGFDFY